MPRAACARRDAGADRQSMTDSSLLRRMADFDLTDTQRQVRAAVREFAEREILPTVEQHEREGRYPREVIARLAPLGYLAPLIPETYGGSFVDVVTYGVILRGASPGGLGGR